MADKRSKYHFALIEEQTLREVFHFRVSLLGAITTITLSIIGLIILLSILIVFTPLRNIMPGYGASIREQLIEQSAKVDSLQSSLTVQRQYLDVIKQLTAGDIEMDSVQSLDSLQRVEKARLVAEANEATETFKAQYEQREKDRMALYDAANTHPVRRLQRPVRGVVVQPARPDLRVYGVSLRTAKNENVLATTRGTLVSVERMADNSFTMVLQHNAFVTVYRHVSRALKNQGASVEESEVLGVCDGESDIIIELWEAGQFVNPEEMIVW